MGGAREAIEAAAAGCGRLRARLAGGGKQVRGASELRAIRALATAWFESQRPAVSAAVPVARLEPVDRGYQELIARAGRATLRSRYRLLLRRLRAALVELQASEAAAIASAAVEPLPDFPGLLGDPAMAAILARRWLECTACLAAGAPLAACVMMGGMLEGLLLARLNRLPEKSAAFTAKSAPRDRSGNPLPLARWSLSDLLAVAKELRWISGAMHGFADVVRDYRNWIHPEKEYAAAEAIRLEDARAMWEISKHILRELARP